MSCKIIFNAQNTKVGVDYEGKPSKLFQQIYNNSHIQTFDDAVSIYQEFMSLNIPESDLRYKTPNNEVFSTFSEALKATNDGEIQATVRGKTLFSISANTNTKTFPGLLNNLIKSNLLSGETYVDNEGKTIHKSVGNSEAKQIISSIIAEKEAKQHLGRAVKSVAYGGLHFDENRLNGEIEVSKKNGESTFVSKKELNEMSFKELGDKFDDAIGILAARELNQAIKTHTTSIENNPSLVPENVLQEKLLKLLQKMGIKTLSLTNYVERYSNKNGVPPSASALADLGQKIIAFKDGAITSEDLNEEVAHFIIASTPKADLENILRNIHQTQEWAENSQHYREQYSKSYTGENLENIVREEVLGKVLANAMLREFTQREESSETEKSIIDKIAEFFDKFFDRIEAFFKPAYETELNNYLDGVYANLMQDSLYNKLDMSLLENRRDVLFSLDKSKRDDVTELYNKAVETLTIINAQQQALSKRGGQAVNKQLIKEAREGFKLIDNQKLSKEEDAIRKLKAISNISLVAKKQVDNLSRAVSKKRGGEFPFTQEENAVFEMFKNITLNLLSEVKALMGNQVEYKVIKKQIEETQATFEKLNGIVRVGENTAIQSLVDRVAIKHNLTQQQKKGLEDAIKASQKDTNVLHTFLGSLIAARSPLLNIAGDINATVQIEHRKRYLDDIKPLVQVLESVNMSPKELKSFKKGGWLINDIDNVKLEDFQQRVKEVVYKDITKKEYTEEGFESLEDIDLKLYNKEYKAILEEIKTNFFKDSYIDEQAELFTDLNQTAVDIHKKHRAQLAEIRAKYTKKGITIYDENGRKEIQEINKARNILANFYDATGKLKEGLSKVYNEDTGKYDVIITKDADENSEGAIAFSLNTISEYAREGVKKGLPKDSNGNVIEQGVPQRFIEEWDKLTNQEDKINFLFLNAYVGFNDDFWDNFGKADTLFKKLQNAKTDENSDEIDEIIEEINTAQQKIARIQRSNRVFNRPSETDVMGMGASEKEVIKESAQDLEYAFSKANTFLAKESQEDSEKIYDTKVNDAFKEELEDSGIETLDGKIEFIQRHVTDRNKNNINKAVVIAKNLISGKVLDIPNSLKSAFTKGMKKEEIEQALLEYAQSKLLPYFKRTEPIGFTESLDKLKSGGTLEEFIANPNVKINPNFSFYDNSSNDNINGEFLENKEKGRLQIRKGDITLKHHLFKGEVINFDDKSFEELKKDNRRYRAWQALVDLQKKTISNLGLEDSHNLYRLPQIGKRGFRQAQDVIQKFSDGKVWKEGLKDLLQFREDESELGQDYEGKSATKLMSSNIIPMYYVNTLENQDDLSDELLHSYALMNQQSALYKARVDNLGDMLSVKKAILDTTFENKSAEASNTFKMWKSSMDYNFYGIKENLQYSVNVLGLVKVDLAKVLKNFIKFSSFVNLSGLTVPFTNLLQSSVNKSIETIVGEKVNNVASSLGNKEFRKLASASMGEVLGVNSKSKLNIFLEVFGISDVTSKRYENSNYSKYTRGLGKLPHITHEMANFPTIPRTVLAVLMDNRYYSYETKLEDGTTVKESRIMNYNQFKSLQRIKGISDNKQIELDWKKQELFYDDMQTKNGVYSIDKVNASKKLGIPEGEQLDEYLNNVHLGIGTRVKSAVQNVDMAISDEEKSIWARNSLSNLVLQHSGWLLIATANKFKSGHLNIATGIWEEGNWQTAGRFIKEITTGATKRNGASYLQHVKNVWDGVNLKDKDGNIDFDKLDNQRRNLARTGVEIAVVNGLFLIGLLLANMKSDDDDKDKDLADKMIDLAYYFTYRTTNEVASSTVALPLQYVAKIKSPVVSLSTMGEVATSYKIFSGDIVKSGKFKGETESWKKINKLVPFIKDYTRLTNIDRETNSYKHFNEDGEKAIALSYLFSEDEK
jgi:DNA-binding protein YbaB